jgi:hypothetical protein
MSSKLIAISVILLFIGVAVAPSINTNVVKASNDNDLVEVTTQACGIQGFGNTTVKLTREQYQNLEQYLVEFRARLNQTSTREEAVPIFKEAVVELDKYGLLPKGMGVEKAQRLVIKSYNQRFKFGDSQVFDPDANYFCLVSGLTSQTVSIGFLAYYANRFALSSFWVETLGQIADWLYSHHLSFLIIPGTFILVPILLWAMFGGVITVFANYLPFRLFSVLVFGMNDHYRTHPSSGWVNSIGVNGVKKYNGSELWGTANGCYDVLTLSKLYPGVLGFTGLALFPLNDNFDKMFFLGSALKAKLGTEFPGWI